MSTKTGNYPNPDLPADLRPGICNGKPRTSFRTTTHLAIGGSRTT